MRRGSLRMLVLLGVGLALAISGGPLGASGAAIGTGNVAKLREAWRGAVGYGGQQLQSPVVASGLVYIGSPTALTAFAANGGTDCTGVAPKYCLPVWIAKPGKILSTPVVANGIVYVTVAGYVGHLDGVFAYDAAGIKNCSPVATGTPRSCNPLWRAATADAVVASPAVASGVVYVGSTDHKLYAFSAAGTTSCSGTPKRCKPLWTGTTLGAIESSPTVANGSVYVGSDDTSLYAFDASGKKGCSGAPKSCAPLWTGTTGGKVLSSPAVSAGRVFVGASDHKLYAFGADGTYKCSGKVPTCKPYWFGKIGVSVSSPLVSGRTVYIGSDNHKLHAFDALGSKNCDYGRCDPLWTATTGGRVRSTPRVSNGLVFVGSDDHKIYAYSAAGTFKCSGNPRARTCLPLWSAVTGLTVESSPAIANGYVYAASGDSRLYAYTLPE